METWITNASKDWWLDPTYEQMFKECREGRIVVGLPKETLTYSIKQLKKMGVIGLYKVNTGDES